MTTRAGTAVRARARGTATFGVPIAVVVGAAARRDRGALADRLPAQTPGRSLHAPTLDAGATGFTG